MGYPIRCWNPWHPLHGLSHLRITVYRTREETTLYIIVVSTALQDAVTREETEREDALGLFFICAINLY